MWWSCPFRDKRYGVSYFVLFTWGTPHLFYNPLHKPDLVYDMITLKLTVNGSSHEVDVPEDIPLLWVLRDTIKLYGTKYGCGIGQCGACTIHINGQPSRSCLIKAVDAVGKAITTIEGLATDDDHPVQLAWKKIDVPQCGYCQAGQIMTAAALLSRNRSPKEVEIVSAMKGNLCRCGTYHRILDAVKEASKMI